MAGPAGQRVVARAAEQRGRSQGGAGIDRVSLGRAGDDFDLGEGAGAGARGKGAGFRPVKADSDARGRGGKAQVVGVGSGGPTINRVGAFIRANAECIRIRRARKHIIASTTCQQIIARVAKQRVIAGAAIQAVIAGAAIDRVIARAGHDLIIAAVRLHQIVVRAMAGNHHIVAVDPVAGGIKVIAIVDDIIACGARHGAIRPRNADRHQGAEIGQGAGCNAEQGQGFTIGESQDRIAAAIIADHHIQHIDRTAARIDQTADIQLVPARKRAVAIGHGGGEIADPVGPAAIGHDDRVGIGVGPKVDRVIACIAGDGIRPDPQVDHIGPRPARDDIIACPGRNVDRPGRGRPVDRIGIGRGLDLFNLGKRAGGGRSGKAEAARFCPGIGDRHPGCGGRGIQAQHIGIGIARVLCALHQHGAIGIGHADLIGPEPAIQAVIAQRSGQDIDPVAAKDRVIARPAGQAVVAGAAADRVIATAAVQTVIVGPAIEAIIADAAIQRIIAQATEQDVVAVTAKEAVIAIIARQPVIAGAAA